MAKQPDKQSDRTIPVPRELAQTIGQVSRAWRQQMNKSLKPFGLNLSMRHVLMQLQRNPDGLIQSELARRIGIEEPTLARLLDQLEQKQWIRRATVEEDRRRKNSTLTPMAAAQIEIIEKLSKELRDRMFGGLSENEIETGLALMRRIRDNLHGQ